MTKHCGVPLTPLSSVASKLQHRGKICEIPLTLPLLLFSDNFSPPKLPMMVAPFHSATHTGHKRKGEHPECDDLGSLPHGLLSLACPQGWPRYFQPGYAVESELKCFPWLRLRKQVRRPGLGEESSSPIYRKPPSTHPHT